MPSMLDCSRPSGSTTRFSTSSSGRMLQSPQIMALTMPEQAVRGHAKLAQLLRPVCTAPEVLNEFESAPPYPLTSPVSPPMSFGTVWSTCALVSSTGR